MSDERDVLEVFDRANPVPDPDAVTVESDARRFLADLLDDRNVVVGIEPVDGQPATHGRSRLLAMVAAAVVGLVVAGLVLFGGGDSDAPAPADTTPATIPPATTVSGATIPGATDAASRATEVVDRFFDAFNTGDIDEVLAVLADDVAITPDGTQYGMESPAPVGTEPIAEPDQFLAWKLGRGESVDSWNCSAVDADTNAASSIECEYRIFEPISNALHGKPVQTRSRFTTVDGEISEIDIVDESVAGREQSRADEFYFRYWIFGYHPEVWSPLFDEWTSRDDAAEQGRLQAEWAQRWADHRDEYGCSNPQALCGEPRPVAAMSDDAVGDLVRTLVGDDRWTPSDSYPDGLAWINEACSPGPHEFVFHYMAWEMGGAGYSGLSVDPTQPNIQVHLSQFMSAEQGDALAQMITRFGACDLPDAFPDANRPVAVEPLPASIPARGIIVNDEYAIFTVTNPGGGVITIWLSDGRVTTDLVDELATTAHTSLEEATDTAREAD